MALQDDNALLENYAANCIIHTRVNNGMDMPEFGAVDRFNMRAMANDPFRGGYNPILSRINSFPKNPRLLDHDPEPELDAYGTTLQLSEPVEFDTLAQAFDEMPEAGIAETHAPVVPGGAPQYGTPAPQNTDGPRVASDAFIDRLAAAFHKD